MRKSKFTPEIREKIYRLRLAGLSQRYIAAGAGISQVCLEKWLAKAKGYFEQVENEQVDYDDLTDDEKDWYMFYVMFYKTEAELLEKWLNALSTDKRYVKWLLSKRFRDEYDDDTTNVNLNAKVDAVFSWKDIVENAK